MKLNRRRIDARIPRWIMEALTTLRYKYDWTFTEALIRTAEKGIAYYEKQWTKMHPKKNGLEDETADQRCSDLDQEDNTPEEVSDEEVDKALEELKKTPNLTPQEIAELRKMFGN